MATIVKYGAGVISTGRLAFKPAESPGVQRQLTDGMLTKLLSDAVRLSEFPELAAAAGVMRSPAPAPRGCAMCRRVAARRPNLGLRMAKSVVIKMPAHRQAALKSALGISGDVLVQYVSEGRGHEVHRAII